jgi:kinesin family protein 2/24
MASSYFLLTHGLKYFHAVQPNLLLSFWQDVDSEPFEPSPFMPKETDDEDDDDVLTGNQQGLADNYNAVTSEKESTNRENNVAKIKVVV